MIAASSAAAVVIAERTQTGLHSETMTLDERSIETAGDRCEECGAKLTPSELQAVLESGGPTLCAIHAAEDEPGLVADEAGPTQE